MVEWVEVVREVIKLMVLFLYQVSNWHSQLISKFFFYYIFSSRHQNKWTAKHLNKCCRSLAHIMILEKNGQHQSSFSPILVYLCVLESVGSPITRHKIDSKSEGQEKKCPWTPSSRKMHPMHIPSGNKSFTTCRDTLLMTSFKTRISSSLAIIRWSSAAELTFATTSWTLLVCAWCFGFLKAWTERWTDKLRLENNSHWQWPLIWCMGSTSRQSLSLWLTHFDKNPNQMKNTTKKCLKK